MKLRALPGFPELYLDFVEDAPSVREFLTRPAGIESVTARAAGQRDRKLPLAELARCLLNQNGRNNPGAKAKLHVESLASGGSAVILADCGCGPAGGPLSSLLKCLTITKLSSELADRGRPAVPICLLALHSSGSRSTDGIRLLDSESRLRSISVPKETNLRELDSTFPDQLVKGIEAAIGGEVPRDLRALIKESYLPGISFDLACARFYSRLLDEWGVLFLDPHDLEFRSITERYCPVSEKDSPRLLQVLERRLMELERGGYPIGVNGRSNLESYLAFQLRTIALESTLPVACHVVDQSDVYDFALTGPHFSGTGLKPPLLWPRTSATVVDPRSRKILDRYGLVFEDLFGTGKLDPEDLSGGPTADATIARLNRLVAQIETTLTALKNSGSAGAALSSAIEEAREKMLFQAGKLKDRFLTAHQTRREVIHRQLDRVRNTLTPEGGLQEMNMSCVHFLLRYSTLFPRTVFEKIDFMQTDHQLLYVE